MMNVIEARPLARKDLSPALEEATPGTSVAAFARLLMQEGMEAPRQLFARVNGTLAPTVQFTNGDAIFRINGADYVTFDGIDVTDHPSNTNATQRMEYGFLLTRADSNYGCKNVTLKNLTVRLRWTTARGAGIAQVNFNGAGVTKNPTGRGGLHENLDISGCTISDVPGGIALAGYNDPVRPRLYPTDVYFVPAGE